MKTQQKEEAPEGVAGGKIVELNEAVIQEERLNTVVLSTVEETLNLLLDAMNAPRSVRAATGASCRPRPGK